MVWLGVSVRVCVSTSRWGWGVNLVVLHDGVEYLEAVELVVLVHVVDVEEVEAPLLLSHLLLRDLSYVLQVVSDVRLVLHQLTCNTNPHTCSSSSSGSSTCRFGALHTRNNASSCIPTDFVFPLLYNASST